VYAEGMLSSRRKGGGYCHYPHPLANFSGFLAIEWSQQLLFFQRLEERSSYGAIERKILERHNEATELYLLWERERDKERLSHHECQVVTFFVPNFCKLSTAIIITNTLARAWANLYAVTVSRETPSSSSSLGYK
jgi:hypothetical protein